MALEERDEKRARQTDDVEVVAFDPLDETAAEALDRIRAGTALPLPAREIRLDELGRERPEGHSGPLVAHQLEGGAEQAQPRNDGVRATGEGRQHARGFLT